MEPDKVEQIPETKKPKLKKLEMKADNADMAAEAKPPISPRKPPLPRLAILSMRKFSADQGLPRVRAMSTTMSSRTSSAPNLNKPPHQLNQTMTRENSQSSKASTLSTGHNMRPWRLNFGVHRRSLELSEAPLEQETGTVAGLGFKKSL